MALWTQQDLTDVAAAYKAAVINGVFSCTVAGQNCQSWSPDQYQKLLDRIHGDLAKSYKGRGIGLTVMVPGGCGSDSRRANGVTDGRCW